METSIASVNPEGTPLGDAPISENPTHIQLRVSGITWAG